MYKTILNTFDVVRVDVHKGFSNSSERILYMNSFYEDTREGKNVDDARGKTPHVVISTRVDHKDFMRCAGGASARGLKVCPHLNRFKNNIRRTNKSCLIHATDTTNEVKNNMKVLGLDYQKYIELRRKRWDTVAQMFDHLNKENIEYVVSRNHDRIMKDPIHPDIDFMVSNYSTVANALGAVPSTLDSKEFGGERVQYNVVVQDRKVDVDLRFIGDNYIDPQWMRNILNHRILTNGMFLLQRDDMFYFLLYHALIQKKSLL